MATYNERWQAIADQFFEAFGRPAPAKEIAFWAIQQGLWQPLPQLILNKAAEDLARALREDTVIDAQGREVRAKYAARIADDGVQTTLWADRAFASPQHMELALKQRRRQIVAACLHLQTDADSYNENYNPGTTLQLSFDFTLDLEELRAADAAQPVRVPLKAGPARNLTPPGHSPERPCPRAGPRPGYTCGRSVRGR